MGATSIWHWIIVLLIVVLLFGRGKISEIMGDVAKGIKSFKKGMSEDEQAKAAEPPKSIDASSPTQAPAASQPASESKAG
jgi:sec-independent protein translocase protein TatA